MTEKKPNKPWRVLVLRPDKDAQTHDFRGQRSAYDLINTWPAGQDTRFVVRHWEDGRWVLYDKIKDSERVDG